MNKRLTLQDLAVILAEQTGKEVQEAERFLQTFVAVVTEGVYTDKLVKVKGLGTFKIIRVEERESVSVNSGERFLIPAHYKFTFVPDKDLKELVNKPFSWFETTELNAGVTFSDLNASSEPEDIEEVSDESVEEVLPDLPPVEKEPEQENVEMKPDVPVEPEEIREDKTEKPVPEMPVQLPLVKDDSRKWRILVACLVAIIVAGIAYIAYLSEWFVKDNPVRLAPDGSVHVEREPVALVDTPRMVQDSGKVVPVDTLPPEDVKPDPLEDLAVTQIKSGDRLTSISLKYYGHKFFWVYIYKYNDAVIVDPNNIPIGTEIRIPAPARYGINAKDRASIDKAAALQTEILSEGDGKGDK